MPRSRIEGLLASFPKLIGSSDQHTFVETESVRYVYQPLEELFMVLVTNKQSNILQDIDTLHLFARVVSEYCRSIDEREISRHSFELLNVFDEIVAMGYRESSKEKEAKDELNRKARMMEMQKREMSKKGYSGGMSSMSGFGSGSGSGSGGYNQSSSPAYTSNSGGFKNTESSYSSDSGASSHAQRMPVGGKGMQLGKKQKADALVEVIKTDEGIEDVREAMTSRASKTPQGASIQQESVHVAIEEKIVVRVNRDGGLENMEVKGKMELRITDPAKAHLQIMMQTPQDSLTQFTAHPNVNKQLFPPVLALRDTSRPFPTNQAIGILKWRLLTKDDSLIPLSINCWPSPSGSGSCDVNIEYELQVDHLELRDVSISIPYPGSADPVIHSAEGYPYKIERQRKTIDWLIPLIDQTNKSGVLEFTINEEDVGAFFPIRVSFVSNKSYCRVEAAAVTSLDGTPIHFSQEAIVSPEDYSIV
ncbi:Coatomer subunit delta [Blyttiomyces sp. JEL0837]|nr:Coatomer subunit delta [Blyttiomyces sp. JEL0837]